MKFSSSNASKKPPSPQDGFAVRQAIAQQFASAADFEETMCRRKHAGLWTKKIEIAKFDW